MERSIADCRAKLEKSIVGTHGSPTRNPALCRPGSGKIRGASSATPRTSRYCSSTMDRAKQAVRMELKTANTSNGWRRNSWGGSKPSKKASFALMSGFDHTEARARWPMRSRRSVATTVRPDLPRRSSGEALIKLRHIAGDAAHWAINWKHTETLSSTEKLPGIFPRHWSSGDNSSGNWSSREGQREV